ncbi:MAG: TatD family hydrolase [Flavobacterium sp.]|nr:TatD family hydrolase [Flavobacterium sp.]
MEYFNLHTHQYTNNAKVLELVNQYPDAFDSSIPYYSVGIHPWRILEERVISDLKIIEEKLSESSCLAIGECGLDKRIEVSLELQTTVFRRQLLLAEKFQKPIIIHCVAAFQEVIALKNELKITVPMIIHGFSKNKQVAKSLIDNGFYISFGKYLLRNPELREVFESVPSDRFFLETDTIEEGIEIVYQTASKYRNINIENLKNTIAANYTAVFDSFTKSKI